MSNYDIENKIGNEVTGENDNYYLKVFNVSLNAWAHFLVAAVTIINIYFVFDTWSHPLTATPLHIVLCVIGYQFLMAEAVLSLSPHNGWSSSLKFVDKRRVHAFLQVLGSGLALCGSFIKIVDKTNNFNSLHGQFALVAMVFTVACFFNGITAQYPRKFRFIPASLSKITHICFGIVAFAAASISLCYGYDNWSFKNWIGEPLTITTIVLTAVLAALVILNPVIEFSVKSLNVFRR